MDLPGCEYIFPVLIDALPQAQMLKWKENNWEGRKNSIMSRENLKGPETDELNDDFEPEEEYDDLELLDRLESLLEDMEDLHVTTRAEIEQRIVELHSKLDVQK
jgi:hypothetical protein